MDKINLADEMRKKTEEGKKENQRAKEIFEKQKLKSFDEIVKKARKEVENLIENCLSEIKKMAGNGKFELTFTVKEFESPQNDEKTYGLAMARNLAKILESMGFEARPCLSISEGDVDDPRNFYYYNVEVNWEKIEGAR
ncbi:MAG TPA: hypothetical protein VJH05_02435 [Candidatus Paceibacterota bacterium]